MESFCKASVKEYTENGYKQYFNAKIISKIGRNGKAVKERHYSDHKKGISILIHTTIILIGAMDIQIYLHR